MTIRKLQRTIGALYGYRQPVRRQYTALIGHPNGTIDDPENPGHVFVRLAGEESRIRHALCRTVVPRYNLQVKVAYNDEWPNVLEVMNEEIAGFPPDANDPETPTSWTGPTLGRHAHQHELDGGDTVYLQGAQLLPLSTHQNDPANMRVQVKPGWYPYATGSNYFPGAVSADQTAFKPSVSNVVNWRILFIEGSTNALGYTQTGDVADDLAAIEQVLDLLGTGRVPLSALRLTLNTSSIKQADIFDIRFLVGATPGTAAAGGGVLSPWKNVKIVAKSGGDFTSIQAALNAISDASISNYYLVWVAPGEYAENVTLKPFIDLVSIGGLVSIKPATGVPVTVPAGGGQSVLYGIQIAPQDGSAAILFTSGTTFTLGLESGHVIGNVDNSLADSTAIFLAERRTRITGTITVKGRCTFRQPDFPGSLTQAGSAGNLDIYGGRIGGNLTTVSGSTISLFGLPSIVGTISGPGTLVGAYLNAAGHTVLSGGNTHKNTLIESRTSLYEFQNFI